MKILSTTPKADGYIMPGEFEKHKGTVMIWPVRPGSWPYQAQAAKRVFTQIAGKIAESEDVYMLTDEIHKTEAENMLADDVKVVVVETDDSWARDVGPTYVVKKHDLGDVRGINWTFNAWGGEFDGLYNNWDKDDAAAKKFLEITGIDCYDAAPFVLEGGSIHSDGQGTVLVTEACLLSKGRNPQLSKSQIEEKLLEYLGAEKIIWLPRGIYNDETNEHVDNICAFVKPGEVVLAWTEDKSDPQYKYSKACLDVLETQTDSQERHFIVHKILIPAKSVCITKEELAGFEFEQGEDIREAGERLAASYVNFYIANKSVLVPQFNDANDKAAVETLERLFPDREIVPIFARDIIVGGGNIHCITQQIPDGMERNRVERNLYEQ